MEGMKKGGTINFYCEDTWTFQLVTDGTCCNLLLNKGWCESNHFSQCQVRISRAWDKTDVCWLYVFVTISITVWTCDKDVFFPLNIFRVQYTRFSPKCLCTNVQSPLHIIDSYRQWARQKKTGAYLKKAMWNLFFIINLSRVWSYNLLLMHHLSSIDIMQRLGIHQWKQLN